eukprot:757944-Hanusia_phi.AAC.3
MFDTSCALSEPATSVVLLVSAATSCGVAAPNLARDQKLLATACPLKSSHTSHARAQTARTIPSSGILPVLLASAPMAHRTLAMPCALKSCAILDVLLLTFTIASSSGTYPNLAQAHRKLDTSCALNEGSSESTWPINFLITSSPGSNPTLAIAHMLVAVSCALSPSTSLSIAALTALPSSPSILSPSFASAHRLFATCCGENSPRSMSTAARRLSARTSSWQVGRSILAMAQRTLATFCSLKKETISSAWSPSTASDSSISSLALLSVPAPPARLGWSLASM